MDTDINFNPRKIFINTVIPFKIKANPGIPANVGSCLLIYLRKEVVINLKAG